MITGVTHMVIFVKNQDEALAFYVQKLGFVVNTDVTMNNGFRWLTISAPGQAFEISLFKPISPEQEALIGKQAPGVPFMCVSTNDCKKSSEQLKAQGVTFVKEPTSEMWGIEAIFIDLYGNMIDMVQPAQ